VEDEFDLELPAELEAGVYADRVNAWATRHQLVLDFGAVASRDAAVVTARVRVPATAAFDVLVSLQEAIREYELQFGEIVRPRKWGEE
jgi:Protein of unknown function (DUF3467)